MKTDSLFYRLFQRMPALLLKLAGLEIAADGYRFASEEIKQTAFRLDGMLSPPDDDTLRPTLFAEAQFQPDEDFYARFFSEIFLHLRQQASPRPWYAVVIYPNRTTERPPPSAFASLLNLPEVRRVYLEDFPRRTTGMLGLVSLIVCPPAQAADLSRSLAADDTPPLPTEEWLDLLETILIYKLPQLTREEIKHMLGIQDVELKQTRFYQDVFSEGKLEGRLEGEHEGRMAEAQTLLLRQLTKRFGPLGEAVRRRIELATIDQLEHWADNILDAKTLSAVFDGH